VARLPIANAPQAQNGVHGPDRGVGGVASPSYVAATLRDERLLRAVGRERPCRQPPRRGTCWSRRPAPRLAFARGATRAASAPPPDDLVRNVVPPEVRAEQPARAPLQRSEEPGTTTPRGSQPPAIRDLSERSSYSRGVSKARVVNCAQVATDPSEAWMLFVSFWHIDLANIPEARSRIVVCHPIEPSR
jgi:hypothetical protein